LPRIARLVVPDIPHHVTQRGNRREPVFFEAGDYARYLGFLRSGAEKSGTAVWAYCLMPNHVHLIVVPRHADGLREMFADAHRKYTNFVNWRQGWTGHLWQGRFGSVAMDEDHLGEALRYVAQNPVRARLVERPQDWPHSSVRTHLSGKSDGFIDTAPVLSRYPDFAALIEMPEQNAEFERLRKAETSGRPLGSGEWVQKLEQLTGRRLIKR
jgi:putative transposase